MERADAELQRRWSGIRPLIQAATGARVALASSPASRISLRGRWSLRRQTIAIAAAAMLPLLATAGTEAWIGSQGPSRRQAIEQLSTDVRALAGILDMELAGLESTVAMTGAALSQGDASRNTGLVQTLQASLRNRDGAVTVQLRAPVSLPPAREAMAKAIGQQRPTLSGLLSDTGSIEPRVHLLQPILQGDHVVSVLDVALTPGFFASVLARQTRDDQAWLVDERTQVVASARNDQGDSGLAFSLVRNGHPADLQARAGLAHAAGWQVVLTRPPGEAASFDPQLMAAIGAAAFLAVAAGLAVAGMLGGRLARPLGSLADYAGSLARTSDLEPDRQAVSQTAEFEALRLGLVHAGALLRRRLAAERLALREARTSHDLLDSVLNATAECISVKDLDLRFMLINRAALMTWPEPLEEWQVLGRCAVDLYPEPVAQRMEQADRAVLASGRMTSYELGVDWPNQPHVARWLWVTITPWRNAEGRIVGVVTVSRDVTEQRAAGIRLRSMQADLLRTTRLSAMGAMASGLAHELNQPLAAATNYLNASARLLDRDVTTRADLGAARGAVSDAAQQLLRAGAIVRRLRDFVGRGEAELQPEDMGDLLRSVVDLARADGLIRGIDLQLEPGTHAATVLVDRTQIQQVLLNLIRNAAEAIAACDIGRAGEGVIRIATSMRPAEGTAIDVIDNGPGIDPEIAERLFQPFVSTKSAGMGIGLTICHTIAEGHGGSLAAEAVAGGGQRFRLSLPPAPSPGLQPAARSQHRLIIRIAAMTPAPYDQDPILQDPGTGHADLIVHIVDDDEAVRRSLALLLASFSIATETHASGEELLDKLAVLRPGCLVVDIRMPGINGLELQEELTRRDCRLPVVIVTGHADVGLAVRAMKSGAVDFIEKPYSEEDLLRAVNAGLRQIADSRLNLAAGEQARSRVAGLTPREREVLQRLVAGMPNKVIAHELGISPRTVEIHRANLMEKLGCRSLAEVVRIAISADVGPGGAA